MRIQHNIMAMNAYRNYKNNTSALSKNLERLSSGYKINRAGDDAAGLAISEKMRAQITGLEAAQKNVKDGISLVNTAEGAMQEIQDMLNRMVSLATQSSNGTYDNEVDRKNLQAEVDQLKSEINRIADSANFNGIKLLDGSLDVNGDLTTKVDFSVTAEANAVGKLFDKGSVLGQNTVVHNNSAGNTGTEFSVDLHDYAFANQEGDTMQIVIGEGSDKITIDLTAKAGTDREELTGKAIVDAIKGGTNSNFDVKINGTAYNEGDTFQLKGQDIQFVASTEGKADRLSFQQVKNPTSSSEEINGSMKVSITGTVGGAAVAAETKFEFDLGAADIQNGQKLTIGSDSIIRDTAKYADLKTQLEAELGDAYTVEQNGTKITLTAATASTAPKTVTVEDVTEQYVSANKTAASAGPLAASKSADATATAGEDDQIVVTINGKTYDAIVSDDPTAAAQTINLEFNGEESAYQVTIDTSGKVNVVNKFGIDDATATISVTIGTANPEALTGGFSGGTAVTPGKAVYDLSALKEGGTLTIRNANGTGNPTPDTVEITMGEDLASTIANLDATTKAALDNLNVELSVDPADSTKLVVTAQTGGSDPVALDVSFKNAISIAVTDQSTAASTPDTATGGDWNASTTDIKNVTDAGRHRLASTGFKLDASMIQDGAKLKVGDAEYTFTTKEGVKNGVYIGDFEDLSKLSGDDMVEIAQRLTDAAADNKLYSVGHNGTYMTFTETVEHDAMYTESDGSASDGWDLRTVEGIEKSLGFTGAQKSTNKGLTLQIGDTSDSYNQLSVSVGDMHVSAMVDENGVSIEDIDISTPDGAQSAINTIRAAINYVSSVRGNLGAINNRLDHTANNLSVMAENITDAESTIRDTDIAEEMMAYTKNNILVQSAQAMLAQANQVPQGVLQLLQ